jgi:hypothetical protein
MLIRDASIDGRVKGSEQRRVIPFFPKWKIGKPDLVIAVPFIKTVRSFCGLLMGVIFPQGLDRILNGALLVVKQPL